MVLIFANTSTCLSDEFLSKISTELLTPTIENLRSIPGVQCEKQEGTFCLKGQWHDLVTAYIALEQCLIDKDGEESDNEDFKTSVDEIVSSKAPASSEEPDHEFSPDIDYNFVQVKEEKDTTDWPASANQSPGNEGTTILDDDGDSDMDNKDEVKRKLRSSRVKAAKRLKPNVSDNGKECFKCNKCDYVGKKEKHLLNHIARKHQRPCKCDVCGKKYGYKADLDRHKIEVHSKTANYYCNICDKYLKTKAYIDDHMAMHADNYVYHCKTCDKSFSTKQVFGKHMKQRHPTILFELEDLDDVLDDPKSSSDRNSIDETSNDGINTETDDNSEKKSAEDSLDQSYDTDYLFFPEVKDKAVHENNLVKITLKKGKNRGRPRIKSFVDGRTEFGCNLCNYVGKKESHLEYHIIRNHSQKFICDICQKQFGYNWDLKRHREQVHAEASYICHICSKAYKVKKSFDEHLKSHETGYVKSVFPCPQCEKSFSAKQVLENHIKVKHLGIKQKEKQKYLCQTCGAEFYHKYSYESHMNKHAGLMPFNCDICGKAFASEHSVKEHQITHRDTREFHCHVCAKAFKTSSALNSHVAIHGDKKNYKCSVCGKGFIQKQSLIRHERIHSGYKPYSCAICGRVFTDSATIRKHMILVHKSDPHDWQGDVISDLKKQGESWLGDLTSEPKVEPDLRRKADRERANMIMKEATENTMQQHGTGKPGKDLANKESVSQNSDGNFRAKDESSDFSQANSTAVNTGISNNVSQSSSNNFNNIVSENMSQAGNIHLNQSVDGGMNSELKKNDFWRDGFSEGHRSDAWQAGTSRQPELMRVDEMMELKRSTEYWPAGIVLDASRHSEYYRGDNIPDPRKQIEFWQGQAVPETKQQSDPMQTQLTTLQNLNYTS